MNAAEEPAWCHGREPKGLRPPRRRQGLENGESLMPAFLAEGAVEGSWLCEGQNLI